MSEKKRPNSIRSKKERERSAYAEFVRLRAIAMRILRANGEKPYEEWRLSYTYPVRVGMRAYNSGFERAPLSRKEEQKIINARDRIRGRSAQRQLKMDMFRRVAGERRAVEKLHSIKSRRRMHANVTE